MSDDYTDKYSESKMMIADLSDDDKPREKAMTHGISSLSNTELLALLFGSGYKGMSVLDLSKHILQEHGNRLSHIAKKSIRELTAIKGIGPAKAITLAAAIELGSRCRDEQWIDDPVIHSSGDAYQMLRGALDPLPHEEVWALFLSQKNSVIGRTRLSTGGITFSLVDIRMLFKSALEHNATGIILAHNHPSGNNQPSSDDDKLTQSVKEGARILNLRFIDHIIISSYNGYYSYSEAGRI